MALRWQNGAISNFEYLMYLNRLVKFVSLTLNNTVNSFLLHVVRAVFNPSKIPL